MYNFKKAYYAYEKAGKFIFVIGRSENCIGLYNRWISRYSPGNPVFINPDPVKLAETGSRHSEYQYLGQKLPYTEAIVEPRSRYPVATRDKMEPTPGMEWEYVAYEYHMLEERYV